MHIKYHVGITGWGKCGKFQGHFFFPKMYFYSHSAPQMRFFFFFHHVSHFCLYVFPGHWDNGGNLVWESSKHMLPKHMIIRFCWLFFFRSNAMRDSMSHGWMEQRDGWGECRERAWKSKRELEKELCPVLLSCLSVAGGKEQRKLVGCGVSHVCLTLSDSLLCYSLALSVFTPGDVWLLCICPVFQPPPPQFFFF